MARLVVTPSPLLDHYEETALIQGEDWRAAGLPLRSFGSGSRRRGQSFLSFDCIFSCQLVVVGDYLFSSIPKRLLSLVKTSSEIRMSVFGTKLGAWDNHPSMEGDGKLT
jgi:hypothetical protein